MQDSEGVPYVTECNTQYVGTFHKGDIPHMRLARQGCVRNYGKGACLTRLDKVGEYNYKATCRRGK